MKNNFTTTPLVLCWKAI